MTLRVVPDGSAPTGAAAAAAAMYLASLDWR
jgi:hypothetical protein